MKPALYVAIGLLACGSNAQSPYDIDHPNTPRDAIESNDAALSIAVGILKVLAGYHFFSDIAAGALVRVSVGVLVPQLHARD